jgi:hypothetical protein
MKWEEKKEIYVGDEDSYKVDIICKALTEMNKDFYNITRLKNDNTNAINLDKDVLEIIKAYYQGKKIFIKSKELVI